MVRTIRREDIHSGSGTDKTGKTVRTLTVEHDTVEDVSRDAEAEDERVDITNEDVLNGGESLKGDDVVGVVPRNKAVCVATATVVDLNFRYERHSICTLPGGSLHCNHFMLDFVP